MTFYRAIQAAKPDEDGIRRVRGVDYSSGSIVVWPYVEGPIPRFGIFSPMSKNARDWSPLDPARWAMP